MVKQAAPHFSDEPLFNLGSFGGEPPFLSSCVLRSLVFRLSSLLLSPAVLRGE